MNEPPPVSAEQEAQRIAEGVLSIGGVESDQHRLARAYLALEAELQAAREREEELDGALMLASQVRRTLR